MAANAPTTAPTSPQQCYSFNHYRRVARQRVKRSVRALNQRFIYGYLPLLHFIVIVTEMAAIATLVRRYDAYFEKRPILTMMVTNSILNGIADTVAQTVTSVRRRIAMIQEADVDELSKGKKLGFELDNFGEKLPHYGDELIPTDDAAHQKLPPPFDFERLVRFMGWGALVAPFQFKWLQLLAHKLPLAKGASTLPALKRVAADQIIFAPVGLIAFFTYMTFAEGGDIAAVKRRLQQVYFPTLKANYLLWPAAQLINFRLIPLQFQLPFASTVGIFWGTYLSLANSASDP